MRPKVIRELLRWTVMVACGGIGLWLLGASLFNVLRMGPESLVSCLVGVAGLAVVCGPLLLTARACWNRDYASAIEIWSTILGIVVTGLCFQITAYFHVLNWLEWPEVSPVTNGIWVVIPLMLGLVVPVAMLLAPFYLGRVAHRYCRRVAYRYLPIQPERWMQRAA